MENTNQQSSVPQPAEQPVVPSNSRRQSRMLLIVLGVVLAIVIAFAAYMLEIRRNESISQNPQMPTNKTASVPTIQVIPNSVNKIAYIKSGEVWIVNEDGTEAKKLLSHKPIFFSNPNLTPSQNKTISDKFNDDFFFDLSWSRDGKKLAVTGYSKLEEEKAKNEKFEGDYYVQVWSPPHGDIYLVDVDSGQFQVLEASEVNTLVGEIQWSYDNKQIIFKRERYLNQQRGEIVMANADAKNKNEKVLTTYEYQENNGLTWFPERGEIWFKEKTAYDVSIPEPSLIRFDYVKNQRNEKPVEVTRGFRLHTFSFLKDGKIMYFNTALGPDYGTEYNTYEVRVSNPDGLDSKVIYTGKDCGGAEYRERCYYAYYSPDGKYAVGDVIYHPEAPEQTVSEEGGRTWNINGSKTAYIIENGIVIKDLTDMTEKRILQSPDIREIKWAY